MSTIVKLTLVASVLWSGCTIVPSKNTFTMNKTIELDERALEDVNVGIRLEWIR